MQILGDKTGKKNAPLLQKQTSHFNKNGLWYDKYPKVTKEIHHKKRFHHKCVANA